MSEGLRSSSGERFGVCRESERNKAKMERLLCPQLDDAQKRKSMMRSYKQIDKKAVEGEMSFYL